MRPGRRQRKKTMNIIQDSARAVKEENQAAVAEYIRTIPFRHDKLDAIFSMLDNLNEVQGQRIYSMAYTRGIWIRVWYWDVEAGREVDLAPQDTRITDESLRALIGRIREEAITANVGEEQDGQEVLDFLEALEKNDKQGAVGQMVKMMIRLARLGR